MKKETILSALIAAVLVAAVVLLFGCAVKPLVNDSVHTPESLLKSKEAFIDKNVRVHGILGQTMCTLMACIPENICCNSCSAKLKGISGTEIQISGKDCDFQGLEAGKEVIVSGIWKKSGETYFLDIRKEQAQEKTAWIFTEPRQCETTAWEKWHSDLNRVYIRAPTEREIMKEWLSTIGITLLDYRTESLGVVCEACGICPSGERIFVKLSETDAGKLQSMSSIQWLPEAASLSKDSCTQDSDCIKTVMSCCPCSAGGKEEALNKEWVEYARSIMGACNPNMVCAQVFNCTERTAKCSAGTCVLE